MVVVLPEPFRPTRPKMEFGSIFKLNPFRTLWDPYRLCRLSMESVVVLDWVVSALIAWNQLVGASEVVCCWSKRVFGLGGSSPHPHNSCVVVPKVPCAELIPLRVTYRGHATEIEKRA